MSTDPLDAVFVNSEQVIGEQRQLLADMILPFVQIDPGAGKVYFSKRGHELTSKRKILVFLLARLALANRAGSEARAAASLKEIEESTGLVGGTLRPRVMDLVRDRLAMKNADGYFVPTNALHRAHDELREVLT